MNSFFSAGVNSFKGSSFHLFLNGFNSGAKLKTTSLSLPKSAIIVPGFTHLLPCLSGAVHKSIILCANTTPDSNTNIPPSVSTPFPFCTIFEYLSILLNVEIDFLVPSNAATFGKFSIVVTCNEVVFIGSTNCLTILSESGN